MGEKNDQPPRGEDRRKTNRRKTDQTYDGPERRKHERRSTDDRRME